MAFGELSVLVTGGNGFIASHIVKQLIEATFHYLSGYDVTVTVRSDSKAKQLLETHPEWRSKLSFGYVPDVAASGAFDKVFNKPYDFIIHTASPVAFVVKDVQADLINPAVQGTRGILESAQKLVGPALKRFVLLGSSVAVMNSFEREDVAGKDYTEKDWNPVTAEDAKTTQNAVLGYNVSKKMAEEAAWKFMKDNKTTFDLTVINPDIVLGPMLHTVIGPQSVNETNRFAIYNFMDGTNKRIEDVKFPYYHFVDVRDVAKAHVLAMTAPAASNQRILLVSGLITPQLVANTVRRNFPELCDRVDMGKPSQVCPEGVNPTGWDVSRSHDIFGKAWEYRDLEESLTDTVRDILAHEKQWAKKEQ